MMESVHVVKPSPAVHSLGRELQFLYHQFHLNHIYLDGRGEIDTRNFDCREWITKEGKGMYMFL